MAYFASHSDFGTTRRYIHPNMESGRAAMERAGSTRNDGLRRKQSRGRSPLIEVVWYAREDSNL